MMENSVDVLVKQENLKVEHYHQDSIEISEYFLIKQEVLDDSDYVGKH